MPVLELAAVTSPQRPSTATAPPPGRRPQLGDPTDESLDEVPLEAETDLPEDPGDIDTAEVARSLDEVAQRAPDLVRQYLRDIGRVPLLTAQEEVRYARDIEAGLIAEELLAERRRKPVAPTNVGPTNGRTVNGSAPNGTAGPGGDRPPADAELRTLVLLGREAKRRLIEANLRLVVSVAKRSVGRGLTLLDLIQEGNLGLIRAVEKFDYAKGYKFSTYATWWIRQSISRALADQARTIRIPIHVVDLVHRLLRAQRQLFQELGRDPTTAEIAQALGCETVRVRELVQLARDPVSLQMPVGDVDSVELGELIEDVDVLPPFEAASWSLLRDHIERALRELGDRERHVVRLRYGLTDGQMHTLEEVGQVFGVTRERVRQIEARTLAKLRAGDYFTAMREYLA